MDFMSIHDKLLIHETKKWNEGFSFLAGIDEAGRGCCAGPVVAAAVVFTDRARIPAGLNDSKKLTHDQRMSLRERLLNDSSIICRSAFVDAQTIDCINILKATHLAMANALKLIDCAEFALVDGNPVKGLHLAFESIVKGDAKSASIAAASIIAKTERDLYMLEAAELYPDYGFEIHKGYCTALHTEMIHLHGICPLHRKTFEPVRSFLEPLVQGELF